MDLVLEPRYRQGSGEPLVLIHGFTSTWRCWLPVIPALAERHDVVALTVAGHCGGSPLPDGTQASISALADALEAELDELGIGQAHLVGNSLGGWLSLELARRGRALTVVGLAPAGGWWNDDPKEERRLRGFFKRTRFLTQLSYSRARKMVLRPGLRKLMLRDAMERGDRVPSGEALHMLQGVIECSIFDDLLEFGKDPAEGIEEITCPVLIAWPEKDRILPLRYYQQGFRERLPGGEHITLDGLGHVPMYDDPEVIARTILDFTARHPETVAQARPDEASRAAIG